jgi:DNA-binding Xre family transcriptional regulator
MSEEPKKEKRGGAGRGQGAKLKHGEPTKTIRLPISLVDKINQGLIDIATLSKAKDIVTDSNDKELKRKIEILQIKVDNYARDIGNMNRLNTDLEKELRTAKAKKNSLKFDDADKIRLTELCQFFECSLDDALALLIDNSVKLKFKILDDEKRRL